VDGNPSLEEGGREDQDGSPLAHTAISSAVAAKRSHALTPVAPEN